MSEMGTTGDESWVLAEEQGEEPMEEGRKRMNRVVLHERRDEREELRPSALVMSPTASFCAYRV
jgi:hypothetical protein